MERDETVDDEHGSQWAVIEKQPTIKRLKLSLFDDGDGDGDGDGNERRTRRRRRRVVDVTKIGALKRHEFIEKLIKNIEHDNLCLLQKIRNRMERVGLKFPKVEVRYKNVGVEAECEVVQGKPLPTLWNSVKGMVLDISRLIGLRSQLSKISILDGVSGTIMPGRITLLLGPPGSGKTSLLKALTGNLNKSLQVSGEISYNGFKLEEFVPQKTSAYIGQNDLHIPELTVRETIDFSSRCQGVGSRADIMNELSRREKEAGIVPDPDIDAYMKSISVKGQKRTLQTDYILKILGLDICADTIVGDAMRRGISGGQKKRLTTAEMIVGPMKAFFMDEISNGLDSSTTYRIVAFLQQLAHITDATIVVSLLQPPPETFDLFDDVILMAEGKIVYHGPRSDSLEFFKTCGFACPERKVVPDFLQEVISIKDQAQYWHGNHENYRYHSVNMLSMKFKKSSYGMNISEQLSEPLLMSKSHKDAINFHAYSLPMWELFKTCILREFLLMKRNSFVYVFKSLQLFTIASITMTIFLRTRMHIDLLHANYYMGALSFSIIFLLVDGLPEVSLTVARLPIFYKQRDLYFYPAWAYAIPSAISKIPLSMLAATVWTCLTYYVIGYSPDIGRFFRQLILFFALHLTSISMFRLLASVQRTIVAATTSASLSMLVSFIFSGFVIPRSSMPNWLKWGFWLSPLSYAEIGLCVNEFLSPRWQKMVQTNTTVGQKTLESRGLNFDGYFYWISLGALFGFALVLNIGFVLALTFLQPAASRAIISSEKLSQIQKRNEYELDERTSSEEKSRNNSPDVILELPKGKMVLPFQPLTLVFQDLQYYVETPLPMKEHGFTNKRLQLLCDITGTLRPGVLTALMGVSGAGKTTLLDVLSGRKTVGIVEGEIKIGGFPKVQETFARISGYCEQTDIHSPFITIEESVIFSAWLRLHPEIDSKTKYDFVKEVLDTIELDEIKDALVGIPGVTGLSNEKRKRLTIAVELVANPSIIFLDEPTTGLDAKAAAIVMRAVKNVANTGRTVVCTIHQPSIEIFESFDELIVLKSGGRMIYSGPLGDHSNKVMEYFEGIPGVPEIRKDHNPATWMLEVSSTSSEAKLGVDFAEIYPNSALYHCNKDLARELSSPVPGSKDLEFPTPFSQNYWNQFKACLWKHYWSYWRNPSYNVTRFVFTFIASMAFGLLFWDQGTKINNQQSLLTILGAMYSAVQFCGVNTSYSVLPYVNTERPVFYRERYAGMYASWIYPLSQVIVEIPFIIGQTVVFSMITYPMIGYNGSVYKIFWYIYVTFCTFLLYKYLGMMMISITPSFPVATILQSAFYTTFNLFAGFLVPRKRIPEWWIWLYYLTPSSWSLNGLLTSQYGEMKKEIEAFDDKKTVEEFLRDYFGYDYSQLALVAVVLILFPVAFASIFILSMGKLNFQRR